MSSARGKFSSMDPLAGSSWSASGTVAGFARSAPNPVLMTFAEEERRRSGSGLVLDVGCGAGRNAVPLARLGWKVVGTDLSWPMLCAAATRMQEERLDGRLHLILAPMESIPARHRCFDLIVAHGIWISGEPQCFLTEAQLLAELGRIGFEPDLSIPFSEYNRPQPGALSRGTLPVIYEAAFRRVG